MRIRLSHAERDALADIATITDDSNDVGITEPVHPTLHTLWLDSTGGDFIPSSLDLNYSEWVEVIGDFWTYEEHARVGATLFRKVGELAGDKLKFRKDCLVAAGFPEGGKW